MHLNSYCNKLGVSIGVNYLRLAYFYTVGSRVQRRPTPSGDRLANRTGGSHPGCTLFERFHILPKIAGRQGAPKSLQEDHISKLKNILKI